MNSEHTDLSAFDYAFNIICTAVVCTVCTRRNTIMAFCSLSLVQYHLLYIFTFCASRRLHNMYIGHTCLYVCVSVCGCMPTLLHGPRCNLRNGRGRCPLVVHNLADLQLVHRFRCCDNIAQMWNVSKCFVLALCRFCSVLCLMNKFDLIFDLVLFLFCTTK